MVWNIYFGHLPLWKFAEIFLSFQHSQYIISHKKYQWLDRYEAQTSGNRSVNWATIIALT